MFLSTTTALAPPNPNELLSAYSFSSEHPPVGTCRSAQSGRLRLRVATQ